jgi:hypothetical protein
MQNEEWRRRMTKKKEKEEEDLSHGINGLGDE